MIEDITSIVIDYGSSTVRAGYSGDHEPKSVFRSDIF